MDFPKLKDEGSCSRRSVQFHTIIDGSINGMKFTVEGKGVGNSSTGSMKGKWVCKSGVLPMSWASLAPTIGLKCFANFPNGITHFFQECMPQGYTQERVTRFQDDGTLKTYQEVIYQKGVVISKITLQGDGFKSDSPVLTNKMKCFLPCTETNYLFENGLKSLVHHIYPLRGESGGFLIATQTTVNRPLGDERIIPKPVHHFTRCELRQSKDVDDDSDHIIQNETIEGYDFALID